LVDIDKKGAFFPAPFSLKENAAHTACLMQITHETPELQHFAYVPV
jgi:hypothetical protein